MGTFATPVIQRPIEHGVDLVIQSTTKFYDGHNITVGGAVICATKELHDTIKHMQNVHGNIMSPQNAFYTLQTSKTLGLRIKRQSETAQKVAEFLESHPKVDVVQYPGLASFPQKELADRQHLNGVHGAMLWFEVKGGSEAGRQLMNSIQRPWSLCENLGAVESICTCPSVMTHPTCSRRTASRWASPMASCASRVASRTPKTSSPPSSSLLTRSRALLLPRRAQVHAWGPCALGGGLVGEPCGVAARAVRAVHLCAPRAPPW